MVELLFIRHGQTAQNAAKRFQGHSDTELDSIGLAQAQRVAQRLSHSNIAAVYTSDLRRAVQTADPIAIAAAGEVQKREDLREINVGKATGMSKSEIMYHHPELFADNWPLVPFPGGESYDETGRRMARAACEIAARHPDRQVVIVTHGGSIRAAIATMIGIPMTGLAGLFIANTSITRIAVDEKDRKPTRLLGLNDAAHLEEWADSVVPTRSIGV